MNTIKKIIQIHKAGTTAVMVMRSELANVPYPKVYPLRNLTVVIQELREAIKTGNLSNDEIVEAENHIVTYGQIQRIFITGKL